MAVPSSAETWASSTHVSPLPSSWFASQLHFARPRRRLGARSWPWRVLLPCPSPPPTSSGAPRRGLGLQRFLLPHLACRVQGVKRPPLDPTSALCAAMVSACLAPPRDGCPDASSGGWLRATSKNSRRRTRRDVAASTISSLRVEAGSESATSEAETDGKDAHEDYEALRENTNFGELNVELGAVKEYAFKALSFGPLRDGLVSEFAPRSRMRSSKRAGKQSVKLSTIKENLHEESPYQDEKKAPHCVDEKPDVAAANVSRVVKHFDKDEAGIVVPTSVGTVSALAPPRANASDLRIDVVTPVGTCTLCGIPLRVGLVVDGFGCMICDKCLHADVEEFNFREIRFWCLHEFCITERDENGKRPWPRIAVGRRLGGGAERWWASFGPDADRFDEACDEFEHATLALQHVRDSASCEPLHATSSFN